MNFFGYYILKKNFDGKKPLAFGIKYGPVLECLSSGL